jgi:L-threonylcarbamoyladenylate synthase
MMRVYNQDEFSLNESLLLKAIAEGATYIHPTDTIYGIGCDATNSTAVKRIREAKQQHDQPFSIIAPSKQWIRDHCVLSKEAEEWLEKLPGPYTLILKLKRKGIVAPEVVPRKDTIGVRMPDHWIQDVAMALDKPLITTSANVHGKSFMTSLEHLSPEIEHKMDFALYEGPKQGRPSTIVDLTDNVKIIARNGSKQKLLHRMLEQGRSAVRRVADVGRRLARLRRK